MLSANKVSSFFHTSSVLLLLFILNSTSQGKKNPSTDQEAVKLFLGLVKHAKEIKIDRCRLSIYFYSIYLLHVRLARKI